MERDLAKTLIRQEENQSLSNTNNFLKTSFFQQFATLTDPRIERSKEHLLIDIVAITILAVISGADGWIGIETYGKAKYVRVAFSKSMVKRISRITKWHTFS